MAFGDEIVQEATRLGLGEPETDGRRYKLEASQAMDMVLMKDGRIVWVPKEPLVGRPAVEDMVGTYLDVGRRAFFLNNKQRQSGFMAWVFYPHPVEA
ncbi:hypothetical protein [Microbacterium paludicola]|uniref:hypothetical protein n=1 Tax=Microbacterium paludicola TaxID=300019 RepID=UPI0011A4E62A|nr:hypothetical protein [Microbacterium paludicola]